MIKSYGQWVNRILQATERLVSEKDLLTRVVTSRKSARSARQYYDYRVRITNMTPLLKPTSGLAPFFSQSVGYIVSITQKTWIANIYFACICSEASVVLQPSFSDYVLWIPCFGLMLLPDLHRWQTDCVGASTPQFEHKYILQPEAERCLDASIILKGTLNLNRNYVLVILRFERRPRVAAHHVR